jgi:hypothetical protein
MKVSKQLPHSSQSRRTIEEPHAVSLYWVGHLACMKKKRVCLHASSSFSMVVYAYNPQKQMMMTCYRKSAKNTKIAPMMACYRGGLVITR